VIFIGDVLEVLLITLITSIIHNKTKFFPKFVSLNSLNVLQLVYSM